uniref:PawS-like protein C.a n=1 Tax=Zinnia elegans TaxID=34245 RepID=A0A1V0JB82_ZINEL|nr:PawS-like protein C.a [Zinnia elegans]
MTKLTLLTLALIAVTTFANVSAYRTNIVTTTIVDNGYPPYCQDSLDNSKGAQEPCSSRIKIKKLNHCEKHLTQGLSEGRPEMIVNKKKEQQPLEQCCKQLKKVNPQCQCNAIQMVYAEARQKVQVDETEQIASMAERLPSDCGLEVEDCPLATPYV